MIQISMIQIYDSKFMSQIYVFFRCNVQLLHLSLLLSFCNRTGVLLASYWIVWLFVLSLELKILEFALTRPIGLAKTVYLLLRKNHIFCDLQNDYSA